jgi:hypothetical protein
MKLYDGGHPIAIIQIMTVDKNIANLKEVMNLSKTHVIRHIVLFVTARIAE